MILLIPTEDVKVNERYEMASVQDSDQIRIWESGKMMVQAGCMGACEIMDSMEGANREHMFTLSCIERTTGKPMKLPSDKLKTHTQKCFFGNMSLNLQSSLPQNIMDGKWVQKRVRDQWKKKLSGYQVGRSSFCFRFPRSRKNNLRLCFSSYILGENSLELFP